MKVRVSSPASLAGLAVFFFFCAASIAIAVYATGPVSQLQDVATAARMPIPGSADVNLEARSYGLYFGVLNAPNKTALHVPSLSISIVPPDGIPDPEFVEISPKAEDVYVEGFHTVQVARITVHAAGKYHISVESPEENGGSFSIGELPATIDAAHNVIRAAPAILFFLGASIIMGLVAVISYLRRKA